MPRPARAAVVADEANWTSVVINDLPQIRVAAILVSKLPATIELRIVTGH